MLFGSFNYALYPILITLAAFSSPGGEGNASIFLWGFTLVGIKELINLIYQLIYMTINGVYTTKSWLGSLTVFKVYKKIATKYLTNRYGWLIVFAAILAGPIGYSIETAGILMAGPSIGTLLVNLSPIFVVVLTKWFFKDKKITPFMIFLIGMFILTVIGNSIGQYLSASSENKEGIGIALITGVIVAMLWAFENVIMAYVSKRQKIDHNDVLTIKLTAAALIAPIMMLPILGLIFGDISVGYNWYSILWTSSKWLPWLFGIGFVLFLSRWLYFYSIKNSTTMISSLTLILWFAWVPVLQGIIFTSIGETISETNWYIFVPLSILSCVLVAGIISHDTWIESSNEYNGFKDSLKHIFKPSKQKENNATSETL